MIANIYCSHGTLIVVAPCKGGVVVACDSITKVDGEIVETPVKLLFPEERSDRICAVTGTSGFSQPSPNMTLAEWAKLPPTDLSLQEVLKSAVNDQSANISIQLLERVGSIFVASLNDLYRNAPQSRIGLMAKLANHEVCRAVIVQVEPAKSEITVGTFTLNCKADGSAEARDYYLEVFKQDDPFTIRVYGVQYYVDQYVLAPTGPGNSVFRQYLGETFPFNGRIGDFPIASASRCAAAIIKGAEEATRSIVYYDALGGTPAIYFLDGNQAPKKKETDNWQIDIPTKTERTGFWHRSESVGFTKDTVAVMVAVLAFAGIIIDKRNSKLQENEAAKKNQEVQQAKNIAERAEARIAELEARQKGRIITSKQRSQFLRVIKGVTPTPVQIADVGGTPESRAFAMQLQKLFGEVSIPVANILNGIVKDGKIVGLQLEIKNADLPPKFAIALQQALDAMGLRTPGVPRERMSPDEIVLVVGAQP